MVLAGDRPDADNFPVDHIDRGQWSCCRRFVASGGRFVDRKLEQLVANKPFNIDHHQHFVFHASRDERRQ